MRPDPALIAQQAFDSLPQSLRCREGLAPLTQQVAREVMNFAEGIVRSRDHDQPDAVLKMLCEDLEAAVLLSDLLATQQEEEEPLTPEQRAEQILKKAEEVVTKLKTGASLQQLIRVELADTDCGACDHPTCDEYAVALAKGTDKDNTKCEPGGPKVTAQVELVMEVSAGQTIDPGKIISIADQAAEVIGHEGGLKVLEIGTGRGFPALLLSRIYPDVDFTLIEQDVKRGWFCKRLVNVLGARNCHVLTGKWSDFVDELAAKYDVVLMKHLNLIDAVTRGVAFARPGGTIVDWQERNWSSAAAQYQAEGPGYRLPLMAPRYFESEPVARQVLLLVRRPEEEKPKAASVSAPGPDAPAHAPDDKDAVTA
jgi:hypothetical protein